MRNLVTPFVVLLALLAGPIHAHDDTYEIASGERAGVNDTPNRFVLRPPEDTVGRAAAYGPFRVVAVDRAIMVGVTDEHTPGQFAAMLRDFPQIASLVMIECPGTIDDRANLRLGRMIRAAGLETLVPDGGSVRSGAVELFLAGERRRIEDGAEFAVHAWMDDTGLEAGDYAPNAPENSKYVGYYREMGMSGQQAAAFYAMTNSVPHASARWLEAAEMRQWAGITQCKELVPRLAYLDLLDPLN